MNENFLQNICVSKPYFALINIIISENNTFTATIKRDQELGFEVGILKASEIGRHLAILGSCAISYENPSNNKHYYLAHKAHLKRCRLKKNINSTEIIKGIANILHFKKREAIVETKLVVNNEVLYTLEIHYHVFHQLVFVMLFSDYYEPYQGNIDSSYYRKNIQIKYNRLEEKYLNAQFGSLKKNECPGHFKGYPSIPVAILAGTLIDSAGYLLAHFLNNKNTYYSAINIEMNSEHLAKITDKIKIEVKLIKEEIDSNHYEFYCNAKTTEGLNVGELNIILEVIRNEE